MDSGIFLHIGYGIVEQVYRRTLNDPTFLSMVKEMGWPLVALWESVP